jgi:hypothetical protein
LHRCGGIGDTVDEQNSVFDAWLIHHQGGTMIVGEDSSGTSHPDSITDISHAQESALFAAKGELKNFG